MDQDKMNLWLQHPQTQEVFQYLKDSRLWLMNQWAAGAWTSERDQMLAMSRCQAYEDITERMTAEEITEFYRQRKEDHEQFRLESGGVQDSD